MDLVPTPEQTRYRQDVRTWIAQALPPQRGGACIGPDDEAENAAFHRAWERGLHEAGYAGVAWPRAYGGQGLTLAEHLIVAEELGRAGAPEGLNIVGTELAGPMLLKAGSEAQRRRFLPRILSADEIWCQGFSEPNSGSDLASLQTMAVRDGDSWVVNGQKVWTSNAYFSQWCLLLARTDRTVPKHKGLTILLVPMDTPGIDVRPLAQITGRREFNEVFFADARVPLDHVVGEVNAGWHIATEVLSTERGTNRLYRQARFMNELRYLVRLAAERTNVAGDRGYRQRLASAYCDLAVFRGHNLKLVSRILGGEKVGAETSFLKLSWSQAHQRLAGLGMDILGADAVAEGDKSGGAGRFQHLYLHTRAETIHAGTVQIQRNIIAERLLGLPR